MTIWRAVPGYEGRYEVSSDGEFRSLDRWIDFADGRRRFYKGRLLKMKLNSKGYFLVALPGAVRNNRWRLAHVLVAAAFHGPCPEGMETCHRDGIPTHIAADNLRYGTRASNHADKMLHGTALYGSKHPGSTVSDKTVAAIKADSGTITEIAERHAVSRTHAWNIRAGLRRDSLSEMLSQ